MSNPARPLLHWYATEGRKLPWRLTRDPYKIWLSEVILQQTRIDQGTSYYLRFIERFPTVHDLAAADTDTLMKYWEGLGYYSRARNLHHTAKIVSEELDGQFPSDYRDLEKLKGIGPYTARAVGSLAFDNVVGVLDGNVFRVLSRYLADFSPIDLPQTRVAFQKQLDAWIQKATEQSGDAELPGKFNQAMMDLGSMVCTPRNALCDICPLGQDCQARAKQLVDQLPVKAKKLQRKTVWFHFFLVSATPAELWVQRRPASGLWSNLWEVPNLEVTEAEWQMGNLEGYTLRGAFKHVFTHLDMMIKVFEGPDLRALGGQSLPVLGEPARPIPRSQIDGYAFSRAVLKIFEQYLERN
jgi:A/G-specific adenine glycosylase